MLYKRFGKTGIDVSVIGFGGMRFVKASPELNETGLVNGYDVEACAELMVKANERGVNYFDTSPIYCDGMSEIIFGAAIKRMKRPFYISDKNNARKADDFRRLLERSLTKLGIEKIDFYSIWSIMDLNDYAIRMAPGGAYQGALLAKQEGLIEHICFSTHCKGHEIAEIVSHEEFAGVTLGYNILNFPYRQEGLRAAYKHGLGVATMNSLGGGVITDDNPEMKKYIPDQNRSGKSIVETAIRFNGSHKEITTVLCGMSSMEQVLVDTEIGGRITELDDPPSGITNQEFNNKLDMLCTGCRYCEHCPYDLEPSKYMLAYNQYILKDKREALDHIKWQWHLTPQDADKCQQCGACEKKCTQHLPIISRLKEISEWRFE